MTALPTLLLETKHPYRGFRPTFLIGALFCCTIYLLYLIIDDIIPTLTVLINQSLSEGSMNGVKLSVIHPLLKKLKRIIVLLTTWCSLAN